MERVQVVSGGSYEQRALCDSFPKTPSHVCLTPCTCWCLKPSPSVRVPKWYNYTLASKYLYRDHYKAKAKTVWAHRPLNPKPYRSIIEPHSRPLEGTFKGSVILFGYMNPLRLVFETIRPTCKPAVGAALSPKP